MTKPTLTLAAGSLFLIAPLITPLAQAAKSTAGSGTWYGSYAEKVSMGRTSGEASYMSTLKLARSGARITMSHRYGQELVATMSGRVLAETRTAHTRTLEVELKASELKGAFATSTRSLVDGNVSNRFRMPGVDVQVRRASSAVRAQIKLSDDGDVQIKWQGEAAWAPYVTRNQEGMELPYGAFRAMQRSVADKARPMKISGDFESRR